MSLTNQDFQDLRLSRPVAILDIFDVDDRIAKLEAVTERLERALIGFGELYKNERVKNWEMILQEMLKQYESKKGNWNGRSYK